jgi:hypothetical protein
MVRSELFAAACVFFAATLALLAVVEHPLDEQFSLLAATSPVSPHAPASPAHAASAVTTSPSPHAASSDCMHASKLAGDVRDFHQRYMDEKNAAISMSKVVAAKQADVDKINEQLENAKRLYTDAKRDSLKYMKDGAKLEDKGLKKVSKGVKLSDSTNVKVEHSIAKAQKGKLLVAMSESQIKRIDAGFQHLDTVTASVQQMKNGMLALTTASKASEKLANEFKLKAAAAHAQLSLLLSKDKSGKCALLVKKLTSNSVKNRLASKLQGQHLQQLFEGSYDDLQQAPSDMVWVMEPRSKVEHSLSQDVTFTPAHSQLSSGSSSDSWEQLERQWHSGHSSVPTRLSIDHFHRGNVIGDAGARADGEEDSELRHALSSAERKVEAGKQRVEELHHELQVAKSISDSAKSQLLKAVQSANSADVKMRTAKYLEQAVDAAKQRLIQERMKVCPPSIPISAAISCLFPFPLSLQVAELRHVAVLSASQRMAATKQLESIQQHNSATSGQLSDLQAKVVQAKAAEAAARAVAQRHKLMAETMQKRAQVFAGKSIDEHKKSLAYIADAMKMKATSQKDALLTLNAINAMQTGKALAKGAPTMEVRFIPPLPPSLPPLPPHLLSLSHRVLLIPCLQTLGANAKVAMNNMNVDDSNARIEAARSKQAFDNVVQLKSLAKKYLADAANDEAAITRAHNAVLTAQSQLTALKAQSSTNPIIMQQAVGAVGKAIVSQRETATALEAAAAGESRDEKIIADDSKFANKERLEATQTLQAALTTRSHARLHLQAALQERNRIHQDLAALSHSIMSSQRELDELRQEASAVGDI